MKYLKAIKRFLATRIPSWRKRRADIVIVIEGGLVQDVYAAVWVPAARVEVVDLDNCYIDEEEWAQEMMDWLERQGRLYRTVR